MKDISGPICSIRGHLLWTGLWYRFQLKTKGCFNDESSRLREWQRLSVQTEHAKLNNILDLFEVGLTTCKSYAGKIGQCNFIRKIIFSVKQINFMEWWDVTHLVNKAQLQHFWLMVTPPKLKCFALPKKLF